MRLLPILYAIAAICGVLRIVAASPIQGLLDMFRHASSSKALDERQLYNCTDPAADFSEFCWTQLGLSDYLTHPETGWLATTRKCSTSNDGSNSDGSNCCKQEQTWSTCFLHLAHGFAGAECDTINSGSCAYDPTLAVDPSIAPKVRYVVKNIYVVNQFFSTYFTALQYALGPASLEISAIVNELDPPKPKDQGIPLFDILTALSFGLAFLGAPTLAVAIIESEWTNTVKYAAQAFLISMQQAPGFSKSLYPSGTDDSKTVQIGQLSTDLGTTVNTLSRMINTALTLLMDDLPTFVQFAQSGKYSGMTSFSIPNETVGLDIALKTYLSSVAMGGNGWWAQPQVGPFYRSDITFRDCVFNDHNICVDSSDVARYLSPDTGRLYTLLHTSGYANRSPNQIATDLVNNQWAPLNVLFDGAFNCTAKGQAGTTNIKFTFNGTLDISCISQLPLYMGCAQSSMPFVVCPSPWTNGSCPFGAHQPNQDCG